MSHYGEKKSFKNKLVDDSKRSKDTERKPFRSIAERTPMLKSIKKKKDQTYKKKNLDEILKNIK